MCDSGHLTEQLFESIPRLKAGQCVYVVALNPSAGDGVEIESILYCDATDTAQETLEDFCKAMGLSLANRVCLPVVLPAGLKQEDVKGFKTVRQGSRLHIEFTP